MEDVQKIQQAALAEVKSVKTGAELAHVETRYLGRKGQITALFSQLGSVAAEERKSFGEAVNGAKQAIEQTIAERRGALLGESFGKLSETEWIDVTAPGLRPPEGHLHLTTHAIREITHIFERLGFNRVRYPEVEWDYYAFESLNMPADHPARDEWETFFMDSPVDPKFGKIVLTPHTSNGQVREMEKGKLPIRMINISKCYRRQSDVTHVPMFHQFEGLMIDREVSVTHLKGVLDYFAREFFGPDRRTRLRPFHFRFTEPSFEIDISCGICGGTGVIGEAPSIKHQIPNKSQAPNSKSQTTPYPLHPTPSQKCRVCKAGWLELGGAGMVHPNVLRAGGIDPRKYSGFAFGWGVERTATMKSGLELDDLRILYKNDLRFLRQF